ncbi:MAG: serine hydrolase domain-containing protein [Caulobacteraceae bacterium]
MTKPDPSQAYAEFDALWGRFAQTVHAPGLAAGVVRDGRLAHLFATGFADLASARPVTVDTGFRIASMTKNVTALAILMLRDEGRISLEAPIGAYVPELAEVPSPTADSPAVRVRDLLSHTEGFVSDDPWADRAMGMTPEAFSALLRSGRLFAQAPGVAMEYSNLGYGILGRAISNIAGQPYQRFITERLLSPLGMTGTTFDPFAAPPEHRARGYHWRNETWGEEPPEPDGEIGAMGGLVTSAADYARYVAFLLDAWPPRDDPEQGPVRRATRRELALSHAMPGPATLRSADGESLAVASAYGYGLVSAHDPRLGRVLTHSGGLPGFGSNVLISPEAGVGVFCFANVTYAGPQATNFEAATLLQAAGLWQPRPVAVSPALQAAAEAVAQAYAAGRLDGAAHRFADNLLPDGPLPSRNALLATLKAQFGEGRLERIEARHALAGRACLACENGRVACDIALIPGPDPKIQSLRFGAG